MAAMHLNRDRINIIAQGCPYYWVRYCKTLFFQATIKSVTLLKLNDRSREHSPYGEVSLYS